MKRGDGDHETNHDTLKTDGVPENLSTVFQMRVQKKFQVSTCACKGFCGTYVILCTCVRQYLARLGCGMESSL